MRDQTCPDCGITEAAGSYCTKCLRKTQPEWLHGPTRGNSGRFGSKQSGRGKP